MTNNSRLSKAEEILWRLKSWEHFTNWVLQEIVNEIRSEANYFIDLNIDPENWLYNKETKAKSSIIPNEIQDKIFDKLVKTTDLPEDVMEDVLHTYWVARAILNYLNK